MTNAVAETKAPSHFSWSRALMAGAVATVVMTVVMMLTGMNIMKTLGTMILPGAGAGAQYAAGGTMHLMIGLFYGVVYAWLAGRITPRNRFVKGVVYGLAMTGVALAVMPLMAATMGGGGAAANPCGGGSSATMTSNPCAANPCNPAKAASPASGTNEKAANPCATKNPCSPQNPCAAKQQAAHNPCAERNDASAATAMNPCASETKPASAANACHVANASNPCGGASNPCNPCGASRGAASGLLSALNHLVYALVLAYVYGRGM